MQLTVNETLPLFKTTKDQRLSFVSEIIDRLENGEIEPLKVHLQIKSMEDIISLLTDKNEKTNKVGYQFAKRYNDLLVDASEKYEAKKFQYEGGEFTIKEVGTKYDFTMCNDAEIDSLLTQENDLKEKIKSRQDFLKTVPISGLQIVDKDTGEVNTIYPPSKSSTTSLSVSLK